MSLATLRTQLDAFSPDNPQEAADRSLILRHMDTYDDLLTRENSVMHFTASGWVVSPARDRVLMVYHNIYRSWSWSGGHADGESNLLCVALREVREETGLSQVQPVTPQIFSLEILGVNAHEKRGAHISSHLHLNLTYLLEADPSLPLRPKYDENCAVAWFPVAEVVARSKEPAMQVVYRKLIDKMRNFPPCGG